MGMQNCQNSSSNEFNLFTLVNKDGLLPSNFPVFDNAEVSTAAAWHGIMNYAIQHRLTYSAIEDLLSLSFQKQINCQEVYTS